MINIETLRRAYVPPFSCDEDSAMVIDSEENVVVVVRGWSRLNPLLGHDNAFEFQLQVARFMAQRLNDISNGDNGKFYSNKEIEDIKAWCYQSGMNAH